MVKLTSILFFLGCFCCCSVYQVFPHSKTLKCSFVLTSGNLIFLIYNLICYIQQLNFVQNVRQRLISFVVVLVIPYSIVLVQFFFFFKLTFPTVLPCHFYHISSGHICMGLYSVLLIGLFIPKKYLTILVPAIL